MTTRDQLITPKPIIVQRSISLNVVPKGKSCPSPSPTSSDGHPANDSSSEVHAFKSTASLPNCSASSSPSITFAPLPKLAPRKRKSTIPLGVAARSRMIQQRRMMTGGQGRPTPIWTDLDEEAVNGPVNEVDVEDPLEVFGKYMVEKSKHLWRRVSHKGSVDKDQTTTSEGRRRNPHERHVVRESTEKEELGEEVEGKEGRVWEEEIGEDLRMRIKHSIVSNTDVKNVGVKDADARGAERASEGDVPGKRVLVEAH
ncbi:hypothetical protein EW146_g570 [Bondarzewia mesenterica]|uniref:Uncharacterized protein n=1 Tax=Bondarzewia mesenterica TaxID=1095465 RepID=A0A4S4M6V9_9AGAM|nr:hypothetical protein EW146_g570 [Bondarzewia mesenterica]